MADPGLENLQEEEIDYSELGLQTKTELSSVAQEEKEQDRPETEKAEEYDVEELAREMGWTPKEEFHGKGKPLSAAGFIRNERSINNKLKENLERQKEEIQFVTKLLKKMREEQNEKKKEEFEERLHLLEEKMDKAIDGGESREAKQIRDEINKIRSKTPTFDDADIENPARLQNAVFENWRNENQWYDSHPDLREEADKLGDELINRKGYGYGQMLDAVSRIIREKQFHNKSSQYESSEEDSPARQENQTRRKAQADVSMGTSVKRNGRKANAHNLNALQRKIGTEFVQEGIFKNMDEYAESLQALGEI